MQKQHVRHVIGVVGVVVAVVLLMSPAGIILKEVDLPFKVNSARSHGVFKKMVKRLRPQHTSNKL